MAFDDVQYNLTLENFDAALRPIYQGPNAASLGNIHAYVSISFN